ncbi:MAG: glutamine-hydrolyzing GMP synthase [Candidatus Anaerobiospirillum merdipullorum]|uniref:GMP synthase [glutamine-hydrolyzing] n=1 Tax=Candidatus Anaerobiospirillum merdipullorum TaxID=2838450 RepID=A0A9E2KPU4_9GAMM|nr:glutamine-hydrolyzing GMP synthase [Candidatus Anaerobiospirillum merdipullorum]
MTASANIHSEKILILDFGSQVTQLIARRIREIGVYCELMPFDADVKAMQDFAPQGIILSGGPRSTTEEGSPRAPQWVFEAGVPVLGICYGLQTMAMQLGGAVQGSDKREYGYAKVDLQAPCPLFDGLSDHDGEKSLDVWMSHGDKVTALPQGFTTVGATDTCPYAAVYDPARRFYGVQFHPEVTHTKQGAEMLRRFAIDICGLHGLWSPEAIIEDAVQNIRAQVGDSKVLLGLSGGVDSSVTALLLHRAIGERLTCVFVDNGLLRLNEGKQVQEMFAGLGLNIVYADAEERFLKALAGISDPEAKRKAIGHTFIDVFADEARKLQGIDYLAQGTIYPDVIESAAAKTGKAQVIKSHHNVGGLPPDLKFKLVEPLRELFKDEVRRIGVKLGLPEKMVQRHPFPGPGLGVRVLGEVKREYLELLRRADAIFMQELNDSGWYDKVSQAFTVFLPVRSVGVMGDGRRYDYVVALRAVQTIDFMTAKWAELPYELLGRVSNRIINEVDGISRVVYDVSGKPPATIEWE